MAANTKKETSLLDKLVNSANDLTTLNIETVMCKLEVDNQGKVIYPKSQEVQGIVSRIDLIDGDVKTHVTEPFYKKYPELVQFHQSREAKGSEIIESNIETIGTIVDTLKGILPALKDLFPEE